MNKEIQREYKKELRNIKLQNIETLFLISYYAVSNILKSFDEYEKNKGVIYNYYKIAKEEAKLLTYLKNNLERIDSNELDKVLDMLDEINEQTTLYYYGFLDNIENSPAFCRKYSNLQKLIDTEIYRKKIFCTALDKNSIKEYLKIPNQTWEYISKRTTITEQEEFYGVNIKMDENKVDDMKIFVPPIINLETAKINVHEFKHAYDVYEMIGLEYIDNNAEEVARDSESIFENVYLRDKVKQYFGPFDTM